MKKIMASLLAASLLLAGCVQQPTPGTSTAPAKPASVAPASSTAPASGLKKGGNYTDEMKIPKKMDLSPKDGADAVERKNDVKNSPYWYNLDFYNSTSGGSLTILPKFKTMQQTSEWSCGITSLMMVMNYYGKLGEETEETLAKMRTNGMEPWATTLKDVVRIAQSKGFKVDSTYDHPGSTLADYMTLDKIQATLKEGKPIMICWNDWGGHWQTIIGYDTMGTETQSDDVIIVADSYDTTDHNQDGYGVYPAERFYYNWTMFDFFQQKKIEERDKLFAILSVDKTVTSATSGASAASKPASTAASAAAPASTVTSAVASAVSKAASAVASTASTVTSAVASTATSK